MFSAIGTQYDVSNMEHLTVEPTDSVREKLVGAGARVNGWKGKVAPSKIVQKCVDTICNLPHYRWKLLVQRLLRLLGSTHQVARLGRDRLCTDHQRVHRGRSSGHEAHCGASKVWPER